MLLWAKLKRIMLTKYKWFIKQNKGFKCETSGLGD